MNTRYYEHDNAEREEPCIMPGAFDGNVEDDPESFACDHVANVELRANDKEFMRAVSLSYVMCNCMYNEGFVIESFDDTGIINTLNGQGIERIFYVTDLIKTEWAFYRLEPVAVHFEES